MARLVHLRWQWVVSSDCADDDCKQVDRYEPSSSLVKSDQRFKLDYLSGGVEGNIAHEIVRLGQYRIYNQTVGLYLLAPRPLAAAL
jgi:hypothetical protein